MAGEIEEPFRLNFQADLLHSGSISFGRFESESLSWERRSIFSHNRYLEEVEKYSKPGSVTEKKAYFEAEFKRKALLRQRSSECQDGGEFPTSNNSDLHDLEGSGYGNESPCSSGLSECKKETEIQQHENGDVEALYTENGNDSRHAACFDESLHNLGYDESQNSESQECESQTSESQDMMRASMIQNTISQESESQNCEFLPVITQDEPVINMVDCSVNVPEHIMLDEKHQIETENLVGNTEQDIGLTLVDQVVQVDVTSEANDSTITCQAPKKDHNATNSRPRTMFSPKVKPPSEKKLVRATMKTQANVNRFQKHVSNEASKDSTKPKTSESKSLLVKKTEKKSPRPTSPFTCSGVKTSKAEDTTTLKKKELQLKKSIVKDVRSEKTVKDRMPLSHKSHSGVHPTINRPKPSISSSKTPVIQSAAGFSLKTDQRAENRKEFYMKIAEKMHAKEAVINQVEAKTLEKRAAEMKQFRKSLNFKAKPMPSFYNDSTRASEQHKVTPNQPRPSSQSMATRGDKNASKPYAPSNIRPSSATPSTNRIRLSESVGKNHTLEKKEKEQEKKKDTILKKQKEPVKRGIDMVKKHAKGVHMGKSGNLVIF